MGYYLRSAFTLPTLPAAGSKVIHVLTLDVTFGDVVGPRASPLYTPPNCLNGAYARKISPKTMVGSLLVTAIAPLDRHRNVLEAILSSGVLVVCRRVFDAINRLTAIHDARPL
jgi:hypothetical protein